MFCQECGTQIPAQAKFCPSCGNKVSFVQTNPAAEVSKSQSQVKEQATHNQELKLEKEKASTSDGEYLLLVESQKKSGGIAALLNLILPGAGYIYCGNWIIGIFAFLFVVTVFIFSFGLLSVFLVLMLVVDGFLSADRYNKNLIKRILKERSSGDGRSNSVEMYEDKHEPVASVAPTNLNEKKAYKSCSHCQALNYEEATECRLCGKAL